MNHYEIYIDNLGELNLSNEVEKLIGKKAINKVTEYTSKPAVKVLDDIEDKKLVIKYEDAILDVKDHNKVFNLYPEVFANFKTAQYKIKDFAKDNSISRKITRKNKYVKKQIIATGLAIAILSAGGKFALAYAKTPTLPEEDEYTTEQLKEGFYDRSVLADNSELTTYTDEEGNIYEDLYGDEYIGDNSTENVVNQKNDDIEYNQDNQNKESIFDKISNTVKSLNVAVIPYNDRSETDKAINTRENYSDIIHYYADMYGVDGDLMVAIATQEKGFHENKMDEGGGTGIMQIQDVHDGETLVAYNYETGEWDEELVTLESMKDLENNVKYGCMIFQNYLVVMRYNPIAATQSYNMGPGTVIGFYKLYCEDTGKSIDEAMSNPYDLGWTNYINDYHGGDINYLKNVYSYRGNNFDIRFKRLEDGSWDAIKVSNGEVLEATNTL